LVFAAPLVPLRSCQRRNQPMSIGLARVQPYAMITHRVTTPPAKCQSGATNV
jgi:hypothetical protein